MMTLNRKRLLVTIIVPIQVVLAVLAWRDLAGRTDDDVRGKKNFWRAVILLMSSATSKGPPET